MLPSFATQTVDVVRPVYISDRGTQVPDWSAPLVSDVSVSGCSVQPGASEEALLGRQGSTVRWTVFMPPGVTISAYDGVRHNSVIYQVDGEPKVWPSPTGGLSHIEVLLIDRKG